jgi:hypothetical protein
MACRRLLMCCVAFVAASSMVGTFALKELLPPLAWWVTALRA